MSRLMCLATVHSAPEKWPMDLSLRLSGFLDEGMMCKQEDLAERRVFGIVSW